MFVEKYGRRWSAVSIKCKNCGNEFLIPKGAAKRRHKVYCSKECRKGFCFRQCVCAQCKKKFDKKVSSLVGSKSGIYFCCRKCKDTAQRIGGIKEIMPPHYGTSEGRELCRKYVENFKNPYCEGCGETKRYLLMLHHKDGNSKNNVEENFEIVCANCHIKRHMKKNGDTWRYDTKYLTPREMLNSL